MKVGEKFIDRTEKHITPDGTKTKRYLTGDGEMVRMVAITATGQCLITERERNRLMVRNRPQGGSFTVGGLV